MANEYVVIDLETTGLDIMNESIIEIAAVKVRRGLIVDSFSSLVACDEPIRPEIEQLTGISTEMLAGQPELSEILPQLSEFVGGADIVAHNAEFDSSFLHRFWADGRQWLDTITLAQIAWPCFPSYSLANLCLYLGIDNEAAHRALGDAMATAELLIAIEKQLDALPLLARQDILKLCAGDDSPTGDLLRRKCGQVGETPTPEGRMRQEKPPAREVNEDYCIDLEQIASLIGPDSSFPERIDGFEERPQQLKMALAVAKAFNSDGRLLVEAGTGTGKSLAYLLPAALYSQGSGGQVAVSTHTRNLQEQLLNKDIPMLSRLLDRPVKAAVIKGRSNYLCRRLYQYLLNEPQDSLRYFLMRVAVWRATTKTGDGGELTLTSYDRWKWQRVCASRENCAPFCPYSRKGSCVVQRVRNDAAAADIIILNHSLLIANAAIEKGFLPELPYLVVDEAQHLEGAAEDQLTSGVDIFSTLDLLGRLTRREKGRSAGAVASLRRSLPGFIAGPMWDMAQRQLDDIENDCELVIREAESFFDLLASFRRPEERIAYYPHKVRILPSHRESGDWQLIVQQGESFADQLEALSRHCFLLLDLINDGEDKSEQEPLPGRDELFSAANLSRDLAGTIIACLQQDDNYVAWVEFPDATKKPSVNIAPIELGELLDMCLYQEKKSLVMTSATLAAGRDFSYFKHRLGLDRLDTPPAELVMPSPFHYRDQALFTVVNDLPDWSRCSEVAAIEAISGALIQLLSASKGRAIVLFTSHFQLKSVFEHIKQPLAQQGITVLAHGVSGAPSGLLARLKAEENVCILGANSFWEGVDVSGSALSLLVVVRLPFWPPNTPIAQSRMERIEAEGRSAFNDYSLPQALIRFKQGFGRLIRSDQDSGVFCVLDRRITEKYYGARFVRALPDMRRVVGTTEEIAAEISRYLG